MNLLYTLTTYPPSTGGAQLHQHLLACHLQQRHKIQVVSHWDVNRTDWLLGTTLCAPEQARDYTIDGVSVHRIGLSRWDKLRLAPYVPIYYPLMQVALPQVAAAIASYIAPYAAQADLIHNVRIGREGLSQASLDLARRCDRPFVLTPVHHPRWVGWRYRAFNKIYCSADAVIALTEAERQALIGLGVAEARIFVTGHGPVLADNANSQRFLARYNIDGPLVLFLGQHYTYKGYRQLLEGMQVVWKRAPETHFAFIGPPVKDSERVYTAYRDRRVHRLGGVDLQTKTDALAACDLLCVPSTQESFGGVYTEAWNFGKPVIGCNIPAVAQVIDDAVNGYLVAQESVEIAERIIELLTNTKLAAQMGLAGQTKVTEYYAWPRLAELTESVYRYVVGSTS